MQSHLEKIHSLDAEVLAVCSESVEENRQLAERLGFEFPILSDPGLTAIDSYGLRHASGNPMDGQDIARPGVFIIDREGFVRWTYLTDNWRVRARPETIVEQLIALP